MRLVIASLLAVGVAACSQTGGQSAGGTGSAIATNNAPQQAPLYEPRVDLRRKSEARFERDLAACREKAALQEQAARAGARQAQAGAVLSAAGSLLDVIPASSFRQARALGTTSGVLQDVGDAHAAQGAATGDAALDEYVAIVDQCVTRRGYRVIH